MMAFGAVVGSTGFFITHGFKKNATQMERRMLSGSSSMSDMSKLLHLEVIDTTFSIDGVLGAFAFTLSVPLILIGSGVAAIVVRQLTVNNIENVKKYRYPRQLQRRHSVMGLPVVTFVIIAYFFYKSKREIPQYV